MFNHGKIKCSAPYVPHQHTQEWKRRQEGRTLEIVVVVEQLRPDGAVAEEVREVVERGMLEVLEHVVEPGLEHVVRADHVELEQLRCLTRWHGVCRLGLMGREEAMWLSGETEWEERVWQGEGRESVGVLASTVRVARDFMRAGGHKARGTNHDGSMDSGL